MPMTPGRARRGKREQVWGEKRGEELRQRDVLCVCDLQQRVEQLSAARTV